MKFNLSKSKGKEYKWKIFFLSLTHIFFNTEVKSKTSS